MCGGALRSAEVLIHDYGEMIAKVFSPSTRRVRLKIILPVPGGCRPCCEQVSRNLKLQTKLAISSPGDELEQEADRVADRVMRMPDPDVQSRCRTCSDESALGLNGVEEPPTM